jgi:uncharacterized protein with PIN domain
MRCCPEYEESLRRLRASGGTALDVYRLTAHIEDLGHAESVDWDLKRCNACGTYLLVESSESENAGVYVTKLSDGEAARFLNSKGRERIKLLKDWYNAH